MIEHMSVMSETKDHSFPLEEFSIHRDWPNSRTESRFSQYWAEALEPFCVSW